MKLLAVLIKLIRYVLPKAQFRNPPRTKILIFDRAGAEVFQPWVLKDLSHSILDAQDEIFYLSPRIILLMFRNFLDFRLLFQGSHLCEYVNRSFFLSWYLRLIYFLSVLMYIKPSVVITFIDNNPIFQWLSRNYSSAYFLAVQNGVRVPEWDLRLLLPLPPQFGSLISMTNLVCYGQYDVDQYSKYGHQVDKFHLVGSIKADYYKWMIEPKQAQNIQFDICVPSQWRATMYSNGPIPKILWNGVNGFDAYMKRYFEETEVVLCIALCCDDKRELHYFQGIYGDKVHYIEHSNLFSTYDAMAHSKMTVGFTSSCILEALGWGNKVLCCNLTGEASQNIMTHSLLQLADCSYEVFKERVDLILKMDDELYRKEVGEYAKYRLNYNAIMPAHEYLRNLIVSKLKNGSDTK